MKLFELYNKTLTESYQVTSAKQILESFDWEEHPEWKGVKGTSTDSSHGVQQRKAAEKARTTAKANESWSKAIQKFKTLSPAARQKLLPALATFAKTAAKKNIILNPDPATILPQAQLSL